MNFYLFKTAVNTKDTGPVFPQVQKMRPGYDYKAPNSVYALSKQAPNLPEFTPDLNYFILNGKAKLSDLLSVSVIYGGFLVSPKLKEMLQEFHLPKHQFYSARIQYKKQFYDYYWMHIICDLTDQIDYAHSKFFVYYNYAHNLGPIEVSSFDELKLKREKIKRDNPGKTITVWSENLRFNDKFEPIFDLFEIGNFDSSYYITEKLKTALCNANFTGCVIEPANNLSL